MSLDRTERISLFYNGRPITAVAGQSIAGALYAAGVRTFSRSFKYHRRRGLLCCAGRCANCMMNVDGRPNVRVCVEPAREGTVVRSQNAWPSTERDVFGLIDKIDRFLPVGFYYKTFIHPRSLWPLYETVLRRIAGLGTVGTAAHEAHAERAYKHVDVAVIGGGPAGLAAALAAAEAGLDVTIVDEQPELGGHLRIQERVYDAPTEFQGRSGVDITRRLSAALREHTNVDVLLRSVAFGFYEGQLIGVACGPRLIEVRAQRTVFATGRFERPLVFQNNDLPGVMLGTAALRLARLDGVQPGKRAVVVSASDEGLALAGELIDAGIGVVAVLDARPSVPATLPIVQRLQDANVPILTRHVIKAATGKKRVDGAVLAKLGTQGEPVSSAEVTVACDLVTLSAGFEVTSALAYQAGCTFVYDQTLDQMTLAQTGPAVFAAGEITGAIDLPRILLQGRLAGLQAARELKPEWTEAMPLVAAVERALEPSALGHAGRLQGRSVAAVSHTGRKQFVCLCEDVTEKDLCDAIDEGFDSLETLKRYATHTMGPCQGKLCALAAIKLLARETGQSIAEVGTTTARPPYQPVALGTLAGMQHEPYKLTAMHHHHRALGARMMETGEWKRPRLYTSEADEVRGVRERVGLIDVSTLGKIDVQGKDAARLLDKVYTNRVVDLKVGRVRYGLMCDDAGIILDDGTVARLSDDHFFLTTTSTGANAIEEWLTWWAAGTGMCVHITNVTAAFAAVNLAGPRARDVLRKLTTQDLSSKALPFLGARPLEVAGIPTLCLRIGFVGELGYELHSPAAYGEQLWDALLDAGQEFGIAPFGVEAQRVLRLEKGHLIVNQDTDALSNPIEADLAWAVKLDKEDFAGLPMLRRIDKEPLRNKLVGFETVDRTVVPDEGCQVVVAGKPAGRVTSATLSPTLGKAIGMAWVPIDDAAPGALFMIRLNGRDVPARVVRMPFYDPEGARLKATDATPPSASAVAVPLVGRSALQYRLQERGATMVEVDGWLQAERFGDLEVEVRNTRVGVGVADASASTKLDLKGVDVDGVVSRLLGGGKPPAPNTICCAEIQGIRAVVLRIAHDHAVLYAAPTAVGRLKNAIRDEIARGGRCAHLTDVTSALAMLRLAGPRGRDLLSKLTSADVRDRALPSGACASIGLAQIPATLMRWDIGNLPRYELAFSRDYGEYIWDALFDAGREFGLAPFGLTAWRTLSAEA